MVVEQLTTKPTLTHYDGVDGEVPPRQMRYNGSWCAVLRAIFERTPLPEEPSLAEQKGHTGGYEDDELPLVERRHDSSVTVSGQVQSSTSSCS